MRSQHLLSMFYNGKYSKVNQEKSGEFLLMFSYIACISVFTPNREPFGEFWPKINVL